MFQFRRAVKSMGCSMAGYVIQNNHFFIQKKFCIFYVGHQQESHDAIFK